MNEIDIPSVLEPSTVQIKTSLFWTNWNYEDVFSQNYQGETNIESESINQQFISLLLFHSSTIL